VHTHTLAVKRDIGQAQMVMAPPCGGGPTAFWHCVPWERGRRSGTGPTKTRVCARVSGRPQSCEGSCFVSRERGRERD
jgi:hypothetical protein